MDSRYTLLFKKGNEAVVNSFTRWGIVCSQVPFKVGCKTKELATRVWHDEHGDDVYIPKKMMMEGYDAEFKMAYKGQELATNPFNLRLAKTQITAFKEWLTGNDTNDGSGSELKIYSPFSSIGRQGCYLKEISDEDPCLEMKSMGGNDYHENVVTFKVKFRVTDPTTNITL